MQTKLFFRIPVLEVDVSRRTMYQGE